MTDFLVEQDDIEWYQIKKNLTPFYTQQDENRQKINLAYACLQFTPLVA